MHDLDLVGVHDDGDHVVFIGSDGQRYRALIDDALRAAVRRDRAHLGQLQIAVDGTLRPKDIQARIRAGHTAEQVAVSAGIPVEHVRRFEGPVLAERENIVLRARQTSLRRRDGIGPRLGILADERLATRGVDLDKGTRWDAWREDDGTWTIQVLFAAGGKARAARWRFDLPNRHLTAADDESKWLTSEHAEDVKPATPEPKTRDQAAADHEGALDRILRRRLETVEIRTPWAGQPGRSGPSRFPVTPAPDDEEPADVTAPASGRLGPRVPLSDKTVGDVLAHDDEPAQDDEPAPQDNPGHDSEPAHHDDVASADARDVSAGPADDEMAETVAADAVATADDGPAAAPGEPAQRDGDLDAAGAGQEWGAERHVVDQPGTMADGVDDLPPPAHPADSHPEDAPDATVLTSPEPVDPLLEGQEQFDFDADDPAATADSSGAPDESAAPAPRSVARPKPRPSSARKGRTSVPSWDDILFGAKKD